jgi:hypothetical protein
VVVYTVLLILLQRILLYLNQLNSFNKTFADLPLFSIALVKMICMKYEPFAFVFDNLIQLMLRNHSLVQYVHGNTDCNYT